MHELLPSVSGQLLPTPLRGVSGQPNATPASAFTGSGPSMNGECRSANIQMQSHAANTTSGPSASALPAHLFGACNSTISNNNGPSDASPTHAMIQATALDCARANTATQDRNNNNTAASGALPTSGSGQGEPPAGLNNVWLSGGELQGFGQWPCYPNGYAGSPGNRTL